jgi:general stress protein 26
MSPEETLNIVTATIKAAEFCFLITAGENGHAHARLMQPFGAEKDLTIWMGLSPHSRKAREIKINPHVTLAYQHAPEGAYVTLLGTATLVDNLDQRQHYWRDSFFEFWPEGPTGEFYILLKFIPEKIEVMNMARQAAPQPYGLKAIFLTRTPAGWVSVT